MVAEEEDIRESLTILLSTAPGERTMYPEYGCGLKLLVFENISESTITEITDVIERAVLFFEPRLTLDWVEVDTETMYDGLLKIQLTYTIRATNSRRNMGRYRGVIEGRLSWKCPALSGRCNLDTSSAERLDAAGLWRGVYWDSLAKIETRLNHSSLSRRRVRA